MKCGYRVHGIPRIYTVLIFIKNCKVRFKKRDQTMQLWLTLHAEKPYNQRVLYKSPHPLFQSCPSTSTPWKYCTSPPKSIFALDVSSLTMKIIKKINAVVVFSYPILIRRARGIQRVLSSNLLHQISLNSTKKQHHPKCRKTQEVSFVDKLTEHTSSLTYVGGILAPREVNTVAPPNSTLLICVL